MNRLRPEATLKRVAKLAGVAPVTVSRVANGSENVAAATREKILVIIRELDYTPDIYAVNLRRKRLNNECTSGSKDRLVYFNKHLGAGCDSCLNILRPPVEAFIFSPEERRAFAEQIIQLRRGLDRLMKHTERIQTCVDIIQESYSRRLSSCIAH
jgi:transcriptional regulator with XRE-family HTH domain